MSRSWENYVDFVLIPLVLFFSLYTPHFASGYIFSLDEGQHLAAINELLRGALPFRDIYILHAPLMEYLPFWLMKLFGVQMGTLRGFYLFGNILSLLSAFLLLRTVVSNPVFKYGALYFILRFPMEIYWNTRYGGIRWLPGLLALLLIYLWLHRDRLLYLFLAGLSCGLGVALSQEIALQAGLSATIAIALVAFASKEGESPLQSFFKNTAVFAAGFGISILPFVLYLTYHYSLTQYLRIQFVDALYFMTKNIPYSPPLLPLTGILYPLTRAELSASRSFAVYAIMLAYAIMFVWALLTYIRERDYRAIFLIALLAYDAVSLKAALRGLNGPQFNMLLPVAFITLALFLGMLLNSRRTMIGKSTETSAGTRTVWRVLFNRFGLLGALAVIIAFSGNPISFFVDRVSNLWNVSPFYAGIALDPDIVPRAKGVRVPSAQATAIQGVVEFLGEHTGKDDTIFTFPCEGHVNFLADRQSVTRFNIAIYAKVRDEYMDEVVRVLDSNSPEFIIYLPKDYEILDIPNEQRLRPIWQYIEENYELAASYGDMQLLRRKSGAGQKEH